MNKQREAHIAEFESEGMDEGRFFAHLKPGWRFVGYRTHSRSFDNRKDARNAAVEPCACMNCKPWTMLIGDNFKPGDPAPKGYLDWHEWAEIQHKAGLRQQECGACGKWKYPQELSAAVKVFHLTDKRGHPYRCTLPICNKCSPAAAGENPK